MTAEDLQQNTVAPLARHGRRWRVTFTSQEGNLPSLLVQTTQSLKMVANSYRVAAYGGTLQGTDPSVEVVEEKRGELALEYDIQGLQASREYFVRVSAYTEAGGWSTPTVAAFSAAPAAQPPSQPRDVRVTVAAGPYHRQRQRRQAFRELGHPRKNGRQQG